MGDTFNDPAAAQQQDNLRVLRAFIGAAAGYLGEQTYGGADGAPYNPPGQFIVLGPQGVSVEGRSTGIAPAATAAGGLYIPPTLLLIGMGALAFALLKG